MTTGTIILKGQPLSTSHIYKSTQRGGFARTYMTNEGKDLKAYYELQAKQQWKHQLNTLNLMELTVRLFHGDLRKRDIDNYNKLVLDALTGIVYKDDYQITKLTIERLYDKANPRVEVDILVIV